MIISFSSLLSHLGWVQISRARPRVCASPGYLIISLKSPEASLFEACAESGDHKRGQSFEGLHRLLLPLLAASHESG